jgi:nucleotide-binding universal stress UspA family protein
MRISRILVPVDSSPASEKALEHAVELADLGGGAAVVDLLHVAEVTRDYLPLDRWIWGHEAPEHSIGRPAREAARAAFDDYVSELPDALRARVNPRLEFGIPVDRILEVAEEGGYDLLVMGTHGRTGVSHFMLGSVTERVLVRAPCPVLVVH